MKQGLKVDEATRYFFSSPKRTFHSSAEKASKVIKISLPKGLTPNFEGRIV